MALSTKILLPLRGRVGIRSFSSSRARWEASAPLPSSKPVGAFRGGYVQRYFLLFPSISFSLEEICVLVTDPSIFTRLGSSLANLRQSLRVPGWIRRR
jgi:hypothetical protein